MKCRENKAKIRKQYQFSVIFVKILKKELDKYSEKLRRNVENF